MIFGQPTWRQAGGARLSRRRFTAPWFGNFTAIRRLRFSISAALPI
jgi:hypothetical protein